MRWQQWSQRAEEWGTELREEAREHVGDSGNVRHIVLALVAAALILVVLGMYWSREPAPFDVSASVRKTLHESVAQPVTGAVTTATLAQLLTRMLDKPGGFINNDVAPPGVWLDNISSWERGVLQQVRDMTRALRDDFSRAANEVELDDDLARAEPRLNFSESSWMLPSSESQYRDAGDYLRSYLSRLQQSAQKHGEPAAHFVATSANLERYLTRVTPRLDALVQRLSACVSSRENLLRRSSLDKSAQHVMTPASQIDDVFYEARGSAWALLHLLRAIDIDFADVLRENHAQDALHEAILALDSTQDTIYTPMILNGSGYGLVANHSLVMASYMARADTAVANVRRLLAENAAAPSANTDNINTDNANIEQESNP